MGLFGLKVLILPYEQEGAFFYFLHDQRFGFLGGGFFNAGHGCIMTSKDRRFKYYFLQSKEKSSHAHKTSRETVAMPTFCLGKYFKVP